MELTNIDIAWLAGMIDADGTISFKTSKGLPTSVQVSVFNTDIRIITKTKEILDSLNVTYYGSVRSRGKNADFYEVRISKLIDVAFFLTIIEDYLHSKKDRATLARAWAVRRCLKRSDGLFGHKAKLDKLDIALFQKTKELQSSYKTYGATNGKF